MNFQDYQKSASRTLQCSMTPEQLISNLGLGIAGESGELAWFVNYAEFADKGFIDTENVIDESGDLAWYIFMIAEFYHFNLASKAPLAETKYYENMLLMEVVSTPLYAILTLCYHCGMIADYIKKITYHAHTLDMDKLEDMLIHTLGAWIGFVDFYELDPYEILKRNIDKLWKRYPNGFNHDDSRKRQDVLSNDPA
jgi:NTP pyrophosphatase (non-canonical NTP hydrolase)